MQWPSRKTKLNLEDCFAHALAQAKTGCCSFQDDNFGTHGCCTRFSLKVENDSNGDCVKQRARGPERKLISAKSWLRKRERKVSKAKGLYGVRIRNHRCVRPSITKHCSTLMK
jgi:hypothetical protein